MELDGIKDEKEMVKLILQKLEEPDPVKSCSDLQGQIRKNSLSEIMKSPMMLIFAIDVWESERTLPKSICINFIKIIESFVRRYQTKCDEVIIENANSNVKKLLDKYSESAKLLPNVFSHYECIQTYAGLFLSLGHLASAFLLGLERQSLVFQIDDCKKYNINDGDGSLKLCLDLGFLIKLESTMRGIKRTENFQFCHKTIQEFFAALWLSRKYNEDDCQEDLDLHSCIETEAALLDNGVLIQFLCGLNPESGSDLWTCIVQKDIILPGYRMLAIQNLILKTVKEARDCYGHQKGQVYYCIPRVCIVETTPDEDVALLCKMIIQNNSTYLKSLRVDKTNCLSSSQYHSLLSSISYATNLTSLTLHSISNQTNDSNDRLPVLDLHKLNLLQRLVLSKIYLSRLLLPSQEELQICELCLYHLVLPHDNLVQLCTSLSSLSDLKELEITNLSCIDHSSNCCSAVLDLQKHHRLEWLALDTIYVSGLLLPSQVAFQLCDLCLDNLVLVHDNLVQLCTSLSLLSGLRQLRLKNLSCSDHSGSCRIPVLDLSKHQRLIWLEIDNILISDLLFPSQVELQLRELILSNLLLSDDNLVELCTTLSSLSSLDGLKLTNLSCIDHSDSCRFPMLDLHKLHRLKILRLDTIPISRLLMPSKEESDLTKLYLCNLVLSHDNLVQLCTALSYLFGFAWLRQPNLSCSDHIDRFCPAVQDIYKYAKSKG